MLDTNKINKAFRDYDSDKLIASLGTDALHDPTVAEKFVMAIRQSSCLAIQIEDADKEARRDKLVDKCRELLAKCPNTAIADDFEDHVADAKIVERGYRELFGTLHNSEIWKRTPAEQAWGMIYRAEQELEHVKGEINKEIEQHTTKNNASLDPRQFKIKGENGRLVEPDDIIFGISRNAGDALITLAYVHNWFDRKSGTVILPAKVEIDKSIAYQAGTYTLVTSQWRCLEHAWDSSRLFKTRFRLKNQDFQIAEGTTKQYTVLEAQSPAAVEVNARISLQRILQAFFQNRMNFDYLRVNRNVPDNPLAGPPPLVKAGYISPEEEVSAHILEDNYCVPVDDDTEIIADLSLKGWIRGYAHYAKMARDAMGNPIHTCLCLSNDDLLNGLTAAGLSRDQASRFIELTTFGLGSADLFDTPLLKVEDGTFCFFTPSYQAPVIGVIVLSRIASLNRRRDQNGESANDCNIADKGKLFENRVLKLLVEAGIPAYGFKYTLEGITYDCDVAALIGDTLFVFECKNRSLPMGHLPSLFYFIMALGEAHEQVKRIAQQFTEHPEKVKKHFGAKAKWNRIVPVVLHALPWSSSCIDGVYFYDYSALSKLLREGLVSLCVSGNIDNKQSHILRRHRYQLRKGAVPTADELEQEMKNPSQLRLHELGWKSTCQAIPVSDSFAFLLPIWEQKSSTLEEQMIALGSSKEEAAARAKELTEEFPQVVQNIRDRIYKQGSKPKVERNALCPCGSGKKYKNCCRK